MKKIFYTTIGLFSLMITPVKAVSIINPNSEAYKTGNYSLNGLVGIAISFSKILLSLIGSVSLLMFIYGGILMIISGGGMPTEDGKSKINKGKDTITAALIGMIIVFTSFLIIKFVLAILGINWDGSIS